MLSRLGICVLVAIVFLLSSSCAKLPEWADKGEGNIAIESLPDADSIPAEWGDLISVTVSPNIENVFQLWFQDKDGNVRMIPYSIRKNRFWQEFVLIPRK